MRLGLGLAITGGRGPRAGTSAPGNVSIAWAAGFAGGNVPDGTASGTTIGTLSAVGGVAPFTFAETADADSWFTVSGTSLVTSAAASYATKTSHAVTVRVTDANSAQASGTFTAQVLAPVAVDPGNFDTGNLVLSNGGKTVTKISNTGPKGGKGNQNQTGKKQFEFDVVALGTTMAVGIATGDTPTGVFPVAGGTGHSVLYRSDGTIWRDGVLIRSDYPTYGTGDTVLGAFDADTGLIWFGKNGAFFGSPAAGTGAATTAIAATYRLAVFLYGINSAVTIKAVASELSTALQSGFSAANSAPTITSSASISVAEGSTTIATLTATDAEGNSLTWSKTGNGADAAKFNLSSGGALTFASAPDYETPTDANADNVYVVEVQVSDGTNTVTQTISVTVTDVAETITAQDWRILFIGNDQGYGSLTELKFKTTVSGSQAATGGTASASSFNSGEGSVAANAFDVNTGTKWATANNNGPHWLRYTFPSAVDIVEFDITARSDGYHSESPGRIELQYSTDSGSTWIAKSVFMIQSNWSSGQTRTFTCPTATGAARFWGIWCETGSSNVCSVDEMQFRNSGGTNLCTGGTPGANDSQGGHVAAGAFDGSTGYWYSNTNNVPYAQLWYDFGSGVTVSPYDLTLKQGGTTPPIGPPTGFLICAGADAGSWSVRSRPASQTAWTAGETKTFVI